MSNKNIDLLSALSSRVSVPRLTGPGPGPDDLKSIFAAALRAPDHMVLRPWRYLTIQGDARNTLGEVFCQAALQEDPNLGDAQRNKFRNMPMRAPVLIAGIAKANNHPKVPHLEEQVSCGVGMGYLLLAAESLGYGAMWRTGPLNYHATVKSALGVGEEETLLGFIYLGTPSGDKKQVPALTPDDFVEEWGSPINS